VGDFAAELSPALAGKQILIAVLLILLVGLVQWLGIVVSSRVQETISVIQAVSLVAFIAACFATTAAAPAAGAEQALPSRHVLAWFTSMIVAFRFIVVDYDGWYTAIYFAEEEREPANLPRAMVQGVLAVAAIYVLLNAAFLHVLPAPRLAGLKLAASDVARLVFGEVGGKLVTLVALVCTTAVVNAVVLTLTRTLYGLSRDGLFWRRAESVNARGTPDVALLLSCSASIALVLTGTFEKLVAMASFLFVANYSSAVLSLLWLRRREPALARPWRVPGYPWVPLSVLATGAGFLIADLAADPRNSMPALGLLALSYPVYRLTRREPASGG
jgi:APA family basic amino acid/polyamine antiporter